MHIPEKWGEVEFQGRPVDELSEIPKFWIWMGADAKKSDHEWDSTFRELKDVGITGVLIDVGVTFPRQCYAMGLWCFALCAAALYIGRRLQRETEADARIAALSGSPL